MDMNVSLKDHEGLEGLRQENPSSVVRTEDP